MPRPGGIIFTALPINIAVDTVHVRPPRFDLMVNVDPPQMECTVKCLL